MLRVISYRYKWTSSFIHSRQKPSNNYVHGKKIKSNKCISQIVCSIRQTHGKRFADSSELLIVNFLLYRYGAKNKRNNNTTDRQKNNTDLRCVCRYG